ncbi:MAG TPA: hypothetical protein P5526_03455 [Anaerolineae bacterium]|nr:hypothetical protein [Anaerolineae bacterium]
MKILAVVSGLVVLVTLAFLSHYNRVHIARISFSVKPAADRPTIFDPSTETAVARKIYLPSVQKISPPLSDTLKEKYLLVEHWTTEEWGNDCPGLVIDFPTYYFDSQTGELFITINPTLLSTNMGYLGYGTSLTGAGAGANSSLSRIEAVPYSISDTTLHAVAAGGQITLTHKSEVIGLLPGTGWISPPLVENGAMGIPECSITTTHRLTNYGFQERSRIVTN